MGIERPRLSSPNQGLGGTAPLSSISVTPAQTEVGGAPHSPASPTEAAAAAARMLPSPAPAQPALSLLAR